MPRSVPLLVNESWLPTGPLVHAFFGRQGGSSKPPFESLNLSERVGDDPACVARNWALVRRRADVGDLPVTVMDQVHGAEVRRVEDTTGGQAGPCDALITGRPGCILGILTADCVPLLLIDPKRRLAAAVHAGWRGTLLGVACRTVQRLVEELGSRPEDLLATIGPSIGPCCYSVGEEVIQALRADWPEFEGAAVRRSKSLCHLDLRALNRLQLLQSGLAPANLHVLGDCTACRTDLYFSHRAESGLTGRQLSLVGWKE